MKKLQMNYRKVTMKTLLFGFWVTVKPRHQLVPISVSFTKDQDIACIKIAMNTFQMNNRKNGHEDVTNEL